MRLRLARRNQRRASITSPDVTSTGTARHREGAGARSNDRASARRQAGAALLKGREEGVGLTGNPV